MAGGGDAEPRAEGRLGPLPGGHHGLSPEAVAESQHERLLAATAELVAERGYSATPITEIVKRAAVSNRVFYAHFDTKEAAFTGSFDAVADHLTALVAEATDGVDEWPQQVMVALRTIVGFFDAEPTLARLCLVAPFTGPKKIAAHCRDRVAAAIPLLALGRRLTSDGDDLPAGTEDSLLGGVISQLSRSLTADAGPLSALLPDLVEFVVAPYLGAEPARDLASAAAL